MFKRVIIKSVADFIGKINAKSDINNNFIIYSTVLEFPFYFWSNSWILETH